MIDTLEPILKEHSFFRGFSAEHVRILVGCASNVRFASGETIFRSNEEANRFYLIREGKVAIEVFVPGRGALTIQTLGAGEVLGWSWLFPPYRWNFDALAVEETRAFALDGRCLREKCEGNHDLGYELMKRFSAIIIERLQATRLQLIDVYGGELAK
ncbi:MAG TPA: cyclic nucleotide-binding domain-containing protein [Candidatus Acidoferrales bacterium]|nr:cyclic nucleotide-binding domain-containing protein [Candidatus Acidoferrales bacterium]